MTNALKAFEALGDPTRQKIFLRVAGRPRAVNEIAEAFPVSRPAVSQHLKVLMNAGLVTADRRGTRRFYRLNPKGIELMRRYLDRLWDDALGSFKAFAELNKEKK